MIYASQIAAHAIVTSSHVLLLFYTPMSYLVKLTKMQTSVLQSCKPASLLALGIRGLHLQRQNNPLPSTFFWHDPPSMDKGKLPGEGNKYQPEMSDKEWELRVGRAIDLLQSTMPHFFTTGLVTSAGSNGKRSYAAPSTEQDHDDDNVYSRAIRLTYSPPPPLPSFFPRTLNIEGFPLYHASAAFVRTSLIAIYSDCQVELRGAHVLSLSKRERQLKLCMNISGQARLTGTSAEWDIRCTYSFSPVNGLIYLHEVESIDPAPHFKVYDSFRMSLHRLLDPQQPNVGGPLGDVGKVPLSTHERDKYMRK
ncbi:hypothetical protein FRB93_005329 [Tulasnella sp. JGI-2019a]|nr:hypothetical protein FRB93_005329 [Tulasnella sp. JGI-2019a]